MLPRNPLRPIRAFLAVTVLLAAAPASAQSLETFLLSEGGISTGPGCSTFTTPTPVLSFFGAKGPSVPVPGFAPCSIGGGMSDLTQVASPLTDSRSVVTGWAFHSFSGSCNSLAAYGSLQSEALGDYSGDSNSLIVDGSEAVARWNDTFTLTSPSVANGQTGNLVLKVTLSGGLSTTGNGSAEADLFLGVNAGTPAMVFRALASNAVNNGFVQSATGTGLAGFTLAPGTVSGSGQVSTTAIPFVFGTPLDLKLGLLDIAQPGLTSVVHSSFTATVTGFTVTRTGGSPVTDYTIVASSGTPYGTGGLVDVPPGAVLEPSSRKLLVSNNPARGGAELRFELARRGSARLVITDAAGRLIRVLRNDTFAAGAQTARWDGRNEDGVSLASGVYFARLVTREGSSTARFVLLR